MIKNSAYIRKFTPAQKAMLEQLSVDLKMKNANNILLHCLEQYAGKENEIARLKRFLYRKQRKIEELQNQTNQ